MEKAEMEARKWPNATGYRNTEEMLDKQKLDAVYICVPPMALQSYNPKSKIVSSRL
jgi:myo-inositol 2-dehydrogenase/D-chiro-inositol 1-dehydrogenase